MIRKIIIVILAFIGTLGLNMKMDKNLNFLEALSGNNIYYILIFALLIVVINKTIKNEDKRLKILALVLSVILSSFEIFGFSIVNYGDLSGIISNKELILRNIIKFISYISFIYPLIIICFNYLSSKVKRSEIKKYKFFTSNKFSLFLVATIILICWIPYYLKYFPGLLGVDACNQLEQAMGLINLSQHHPIFITLMIKLIINISNIIFNNITISVGICILIKMIIMAFTISYAIYFLAKKNISNGIRTLILIFFAINPLFPLFAISLDKDSLFACILVIDAIMLYKLITNTDLFIKSKKKLFIAFICIVLTTLIRNNGIYILILTIPFIYIVLRKNYIKITSFFVVTIIFIYLTNIAISSIFHVRKTSVTEMLSIPMQAMARLAKYNDNNLKQEEKEKIDLFMKYDRLAQAYNPNLSDPIKGLFKKDYFEEHKFKYILVNIKLLLHYPSYYIESFLCNTSGYWYPENRKLMFERYILENKFEIKIHTMIETNWFEELDWGTEKREIPIVGMLFSSGLCLWILMFLILYIIYTKKYKFLILVLPYVINYLIVLAGPSNTDFRYVLPIYMAIPILWATVNIKENLNLKGEM